MDEKKELMQDKWLRKFDKKDVYNKHCEHLTEDYECKIKMDMMFCGNKCVYATNKTGTNKVDKRGKVIGVKKNESNRNCKKI